MHIIDEYLKSYSTVLKNQKVKKIYVDGFAGSGKTELKNTSSAQKGDQKSFLNNTVTSETLIIDGSALLSLKYNFDEYYFLELDEDRISMLKQTIAKEYPHKMSKVHFITGDTNENLLKVIDKITVYHRCLMFLDPYALELKWATLERIAECGVVDLWYLFPLSLIRLIEKKRDITDANKEKVSSILGTDAWIDELYSESVQINMFGDSNYDRVGYDEILEYIKKRFATIFPYVSPHAKILKNEAKNSPMFMLSFMMTNTSQPAQRLASKLVKSIIASTEKV